MDTSDCLLDEMARRTDGITPIAPKDKLRAVLRYLFGRVAR
jgi:hypothetical protein